MVPSLVEIVVPRVVRAVMATTAIRAPVKAYSTIVSPDSSFQKASNVLFKVCMIFSLRVFFSYRAVVMTPSLVVIAVPRPVSAVMATTAINAPVKAYSTIVSPDSSFQKASNALFKVFIIFSLIMSGLDYFTHPHAT